MSKEKILIVEDDEVTAMNLKMTLQKLGYEVVSIAENTIQARNKIKIYEPDAILLDISLKEGTAIKASLGGEVVFSGEQKGYGKVIIVKNGDYETLYAHCSELLFEKGDKVKQGEKLALSGNTGVSTGPHLHFEIRHKGKAVDPFALMK